MQWKIRVGISAVLCIFTLSFAIFVLTASKSSNHQIDKRNPTQFRTQNHTSETSGFLLKEHDGYIAIYSAGQWNTPTMLTKIEVSSLRKVDRDMLEQGISAKTESEMLALLEDLGS